VENLPLLIKIHNDILREILESFSCALQLPPKETAILMPQIRAVQYVSSKRSLLYNPFCYGEGDLEGNSLGPCGRSVSRGGHNCRIEATSTFLESFLISTRVYLAKYIFAAILISRVIPKDLADSIPSVGKLNVSMPRYVKRLLQTWEEFILAAVALSCRIHGIRVFAKEL
jgi:hypothetical protein